MKIEIEQQVLDFLGSLAPEPRFLIRQALRKLADEKGEIVASKASWRDSTGSASAVTASFFAIGVNVADK
jgi:hypothetical protein